MRPLRPYNERTIQRAPRFVGTTRAERCQLRKPHPDHHQFGGPSHLRITNMEQIVSTLSTKMVAFTDMEQNFSALAARMCKVDTCPASASSVSGSPAGSWPLPGQIDGPQPPGPVTRALRTKTGTPDAGSTLTKVQMMRVHEGLSAWLNKILDPSGYPRRLHYKRGPTPSRIGSRAICQEFVEKFQKGGLQYTVISSFLQCHEYNSCASIRITRMARDRSTLCTIVGSFGCNLTRFFL